MDLWDYDVRSDPATPARFPNLAALCRHFEALLPRERIDDRIDAEKTVFIVRRDSSLEDTLRQFLRRLDVVLQAEVDGLGTSVQPSPAALPQGPHPEP
jgi:hypothetical protein